MFLANEILITDLRFACMQVPNEQRRASSISHIDNDMHDIDEDDDEPLVSRRVRLSSSAS